MRNLLNCFCFNKSKEMEKCSDKIYDKVRLIAGRSNPELAQKIADYLGIPLIRTKITDFANSEIYVEIQENIRGKRVYFIQTGAARDGKTVNDFYVEALQVADACMRSDVKSIGLICPTFFYARSDKKDKPRVSIMSSLVANCLQKAGYSRMICMDIHAGQTQGVVQLPFDNLYDVNYQIDYMRNTLFNGLTESEINKKFILVSPDAGGFKRIHDYASRLNMESATMNKERDYSTANKVLKSTLLGGDVSGKTAIIIDDIGDTFGTMIKAIDDLKTHGVQNCIIVVSHGVFSGPAISRINDCDLIHKVITTNAIDQSDNLEKTNKLEVVDISSLFGEVIKRIHCGGSISCLFNKK